MGKLEPRDAGTVEGDPGCLQTQETAIRKRLRRKSSEAATFSPSGSVETKTDAQLVTASFPERPARCSGLLGVDTLQVSGGAESSSTPRQSHSRPARSPSHASRLAETDSPGTSAPLGDGSSSTADVLGRPDSGPVADLSRRSRSVNGTRHVDVSSETGAFTRNRRGLPLCPGWQDGSCTGKLAGSRCSVDRRYVHQCSRCLAVWHGRHECTTEELSATVRLDQLLQGSTPGPRSEALKRNRSVEDSSGDPGRSRSGFDDVLATVDDVLSRCETKHTDTSGTLAPPTSLRPGESVSGQRPCVPSDSSRADRSPEIVVAFCDLSCNRRGVPLCLGFQDGSCRQNSQHFLCARDGTRSHQCSCCLSVKHGRFVCKRATAVHYGTVVVMDSSVTTWPKSVQRDVPVSQNRRGIPLCASSKDGFCVKVSSRKRCARNRDVSHQCALCLSTDHGKCACPARLNEQGEAASVLPSSESLDASAVRGEESDSDDTDPLFRLMPITADPSPEF